MKQSVISFLAPRLCPGWETLFPSEEAVVRWAVSGQDPVFLLNLLKEYDVMLESVT
jgi:hypothetical protein